MSLRAELLRLGTRYYLKRPGGSADLATYRRQAAAFARWTRKPPASAGTVAVEAGGVPADYITDRYEGERHILFLHGGGFVVGSPALYRHVTWRLARAARARLLIIDYRLAPRHPFPAALDDALAAYRWLLTNCAEPRSIAVVGDSAGGGLAFALMLRLRAEGTALPAAVAALSPWTDLALGGSSLRQNASADPMVHPAGVRRIAALYLAGADPRHPYASPLHGDLRGLPPTLIQVGSDEVLRDDSVRMAERMRAAGGDVELEIWPRMPHVWHCFVPLIPEAGRGIERIGDFLYARMGYEATPPVARLAPIT